jgi:hypothetical protein
VRFLADESCGFAVVWALRAVGHDVAAIAEISARATDEVVMELAIREGSILRPRTRTSGRNLLGRIARGAAQAVARWT